MAPTRKRYSVLMSVYYKEQPDYLKQSIESMLAQTAFPDEFIIVKDGKLTEELEEVISFYDSKYPNLFTILSLEKNVGLGLSLNEGLKVARNELVARMDSDDISKANRCELQLDRFESDDNLVILGSHVEEFQDDISKPISVREVPVHHEEIVKFAKRRSPFNHPTVMYKKSKVLEVGAYSDLRRNQDVDLFGRMLHKGYKAENIDQSLLHFRLNDSLLKRRRSWENSKLYIKAIKRLYKLGFSSYKDYLIVLVLQTIIFLTPLFLQNILYKKFLRKKAT